MPQWLEVLGMLISLAGVVVNLAKKDHPYVDVVLLVWEIVFLAATVWSLGVAGFLLFLGVNILVILAKSVKLAAEQEDQHQKIAIQTKTTKQAVGAAQAQIWKNHKTLHGLGSRGIARLMDLISQHHRSLPEVEAMVVPIAHLYIINKPDVELAQLVDDFDTLLRVWGKPATEATSVADTLTGMNSVSAGTFQQNMDAMIAVRRP
jgi:hypothetical protein